MTRAERELLLLTAHCVAAMARGRFPGAVRLIMGLTRQVAVEADLAGHGTPDIDRIARMEEMMRSGDRIARMEETMRGRGPAEFGD